MRNDARSDTYLDGSPNATILSLGWHKKIKKISFHYDNYRLHLTFCQSDFMQQIAP